MKTDVAVIVCTHLSERAPHLLKALEGLTEQITTPDEVIVVVDGNPGLAAAVRSWGFAVQVVSLVDRQGLAGARNAGVAACLSDVILFLDDDALPEPDWVELLSNPFCDPNVLGVSGSSEPIWPAKEPEWFPGEFLWTVGCSYHGQPSERAVVRNVYGGCCGLRRKLFTELNGYDVRLGRSPSTTGGGEEAELCLRAQQRWPDGIFFHEPRARIHHHVTEDRLRAQYLVRRTFDEGVMKAAVAQMRSRALAPERSFATRLPLAVVRYAFAACKGDRNALRKAAISVLLAGSVMAGLVRGSVSRIDTPAPPLVENDAFVLEPAS